MSVSTWGPQEEDGPPRGGTLPASWGGVALAGQLAPHGRQGHVHLHSPALPAVALSLAESKSHCWGAWMGRLSQLNV